jgi:multiple sugar transport system substrate-binding protein
MAALTSDSRARAFWLQLQYTRSTPKIPEWERIATKITQYGEAAIRGEMAVDEALERLDRDVDAILEKRRWLIGRGG